MHNRYCPPCVPTCMLCDGLCSERSRFEMILLQVASKKSTCITAMELPLGMSSLLKCLYGHMRDADSRYFPRSLLALETTSPICYYRKGGGKFESMSWPSETRRYTHRLQIRRGQPAWACRCFLLYTVQLYYNTVLQYASPTPPRGLGPHDRRSGNLPDTFAKNNQTQILIGVSALRAE